MLVREALAEKSAALAAAGIETPGLDAGLLLAHVLNTSRSSLIAAGNQPLAEAPLAAFDALITRRLAGECVAYITGTKEFYGLEFTVTPAVLVPRPDTEILVEAALAALKKMTANNQPLKVLDLCTGSGAVAIALQHTRPTLEVWATDINAEALEVAKANAVKLLSKPSINFCHGDLYDARPSLTFSLIVSNPPYVASADIPGLPPEVRAEPLLALDGGNDGLDLIRTIIARASDYLCPGGTLLLEADPQQMQAIATLLQQAGFGDIIIHKDLSGKERVIGGVKS